MSSLKLPFFLLLFFISSETFSNELKNIAQKVKWKKLLHYPIKSDISSQKSKIDDKKFFNDPSGHINLYWELKKSIELAQIKKQGEEHFQCQFPARFKFLKENTNIKFPKINCHDLNWWLSRLNAKSLSLVFSSYYPSNPASMFGHTLLKVNSEEQGFGKLSDFSINYSADTERETGFLYIIKGLFGGYRGLYSFSPYYNYINDYINAENRDLWEYKLKLTQNEILWILLHVWELDKHVHFNYLFLTENCSKNILQIINVGRDEWDLASGFSFYTLPIDTIKEVEKYNLIDKKYFRPSYRKKFYHRLAHLTQSEKKTFNLIQNDKIPFEDIKNVKIIEAYTSYLRLLRYKFGDDKEYVEKIKPKIKNLLIHRSQLPDRNTTPPVQRSENPLNAHHSYLLNYGLGHHSTYKTFQEYKFRFGIHDFLSHDYGLPKGSTLEFLAPRLRYYHDTKKLIFKDIKIINIMALNKFDTYTKDLSWGIKLEFKKPDQYLTLNKYFFNIKPSVGLGDFFLNEQLQMAIMINSNISYGSNLLHRNYKIAPGTSFLIKYRMSHRVQTSYIANYNYNLNKGNNQGDTFDHKLNLGYLINRTFEVLIDYKSISKSPSEEKAINILSSKFNFFF